MRTTDRNGLKMPDGDDIGFPGAMEDNTEIIDDAISKCNFYAGSDPLVTDDSTKGYSVGSLWFNGTSKIFQCVDPTANNAIWKQIFPSLAHHATHETGGSDVISMSNLKHASLHQSGGADAIKLDDLSAPDDNTDLNVSTSKHGLCPKAPNDSYQALLGNGAWGYPLPDGWIPAGETWTYSGADDPSFTFTIPGDKTGKYYRGMKIALTQTTVKLFIITKVEYSDPNTTITVYGGTDYDLANAAITDPYYSMMRAPAGFPMDPAKWTVLYRDTSTHMQDEPTKDVWYNPDGLYMDLPIGAWNVFISVQVQAVTHEAEWFGVYGALSTSNNSLSDTDLKFGANYGAALVGVLSQASTRKHLTLASKTRYYFIITTDATSGDFLTLNGTAAPIRVEAVCAYL